VISALNNEIPPESFNAGNSAIKKKTIPRPPIYRAQNEACKVGDGGVG